MNKDRENQRGNQRRNQGIRLSRQDFLRLAAIGGLAAGAAACVPAVIGSEIPLVNTAIVPDGVPGPSKDAPSATSTPSPDQTNISDVEVRAVPVTDLAAVKDAGTAHFRYDTVSLYDQDGKIEAKPVSQSGLVLVGLTSINTGEPGSTPTEFSLVTSTGGIEHITMKTAYGKQVMLVGREYINVISGHKFTALGLYGDKTSKTYPVEESDTSEFLPVLTQEYDETGKFISGWFYDLHANPPQFHKIAEVQEGTDQLISLAEPKDNMLTTGRALMATEGKTDWNFGWMADGRFGIRSLDDKPIRTWDGTNWVEPRKEYKGAAIYTDDELRSMILENGSTRPGDWVNNPKNRSLLASYLTSVSSIQAGMFIRVISESRTDKTQWHNSVEGKPSTLYGMYHSAESDHTVVVWIDNKGDIQLVVIEGQITSL